MRPLQINLILILLLSLKMELAMAFEFQCAHEKDTAPALDQTADALFQQARAQSKERIPNWTQVAELYQQAVEQDHWKAMHNLAELYLNGKGVTKDTNKAIDLYSRMIELEVPLGFYDMSVMVQRGIGVSQSDRDAMLFLLNAADKGNPNAQTQIGIIYLYERRDPSKGLPYLHCAAEQDFANANLELARYYKILDRNYPVALHYYQRAASLGEGKGALAIEDVFRHGELGYEKNDSVSDAYNEISSTLYNNPDVRFPNLATDHPLPPHPIQGYHADKDINWQPSGNEDDY